MSSMTQAPGARFLSDDQLKSRVYTYNYEGGAITATKGVLDSLFAGGNLNLGVCNAPQETVTVKSHTRTRVIGLPGTSVAGYSYTEKKYPTTDKGARSGGEAISVLIQGEWWTARLSGSHQAFMAFLCANGSALAGPVTWRSQKGTVYGPVSPGI